MIFLLQTCGDIISFSPTYNGVRFFSKIISHERYLFLVEEFFSPGISLQEFFFPSKSFFKKFFPILKSPHIPKSNGRLRKETNNSKFDSYSVRNSVGHIPYHQLPFEIVACTFFPTTFLEIAVDIIQNWAEGAQLHKRK